ncbi:MAG: LTA synthase family protein [Pyrinomonadaceae bacterium]|nr:LTA synthase family protein [Pyrinomonadaceae bacterium]
MKPNFFEKIIVALSLSNLLFISSWRRILYPQSEPYHIKFSTSFNDYSAILLTVVFTALVFLGGVKLSSTIFKKQTVPKLFFLLAFGIVLNSFRVMFLWNDSSITLKIILFLLSGSIFIFLITKVKNKIFSYLCTVLMVFSPFVILTFSQAVWGMINYRKVEEVSFADQLAKIKTQKTGNLKNRVVWIIFDELGNVFSPDVAPPKLKLSEFEKLKKESLMATNAIQPGDMTLKSIPSLLTGKIVEDTRFIDNNDLLLFYKNQESSRFSENPTIFSKVKALGGNTSLIGWHHSYCRIIGQDLSACHWESSNLTVGFEEQKLFPAVLSNFQEMLNFIPFIGFSLFENIKQNKERKNYTTRHFQMMDVAQQSVVNSKIDLAVIHLPFPHNPFFYQPETDSFDNKAGNYLDNLALTDQVLGSIRQNMEKAGVWDNTTVIISSDHHWRVSLYKKNGWGDLDDLIAKDESFATMKNIENAKIPFFIKLKNQKESVIYEKPFNTVITHDLILAIMKGEIENVEDLKKYLAFCVP